MPSFLSPANLVNILQQSSELSVLVLAEAIILIVGKFDLSLELIVGIAPMFAAWLVTSAALNGSGLMINPYLAVAVMFIVGIAIGWFNGLLIVYLGLNAFIATLAMLILLRGVTIGMTNGRTLYDLPAPFLYLGNAAWLGIPASVWLAAALNAVRRRFFELSHDGAALCTRSAATRRPRARPAFLSTALSGRVFAVAGGLAALSGLMLTGRMASVLSGQGQNMIFTVFAACVIGRISLNGGTRLDPRRALRSDPARHHFKHLDIVEHSDVLDFRDLWSDHPVLLDPHAPDLRQVLPERLIAARVNVPHAAFARDADRKRAKGKLAKRFCLSSPSD